MPCRPAYVHGAGGGLFDNDGLNDHRKNDRSSLGSTDDFLASLDTSRRVAAAAPFPGPAAGSEARGYLFEGIADDFEAGRGNVFDLSTGAGSALGKSDGSGSRNHCVDEMVAEMMG